MALTASTSTVREEWTFLDKSTSNYTHAVHPYPARMHPEIAKKVIQKYGTDDGLVFDPFMGSGGVLLEGVLAGHSAVGIDVNPFAVLLSKVKTTPIRDNLHRILSDIIKDVVADLRTKKRYPNLLPDMDINLWYSRDVSDCLVTLKHHIFKLSDTDIRDFFKICLSLTIRKASYQRNGSWKIHRMKGIDEFNPDTLNIFTKVTNAAITMMNSFVRAKPKGIAYPILGDTRDLPYGFSRIKSVLENYKLNLVVTSPPYGDHGTTVAYGQFVKHPSLWLNMPPDDVLAVDKVGLGGRHKESTDNLGSDTLHTTLDTVRDNDILLTKNGKPRRVKDVYAFFHDVDVCMGRIASVLVENKSHCCFVVGNRTVRRVSIPTDVIIVELGKKWGFRLERVIKRRIPNKVMPLRNAPENIANNSGTTIAEESVIILKY